MDLRPTRLTFGCALLGMLAACGGNPAAPTPTGPTPSVRSVSPNTGSTLGGTVVAITGSNFAAGAGVTIGGTAASAVTVISSTQINATTAQHAAGAADVAVVVSGRIGSLPGGFTYAAPPPMTNTSPVIQSIVAKGSRPGEPADFADVGEEIGVTANVQDKETPTDQLTYEWSADVGTFTGTGARVNWKAPASGPTPLTATLTLTVIERYRTTDANGLPVDAENRVTDTRKVKVHDSVIEVGDMATEFLVNFSKSAVPVDTVLKDFTPTCQGEDNERSDVEKNRANYTITSYTVDPAKVTINFKGSCNFVNGVRLGDACSESAVVWNSTKTSGGTERAWGVDQIAAVYLSGRWWLCSSDFDGHTLSGTRFFGGGGRIRP
jgi:IPT/TIG domain